MKKKFTEVEDVKRASSDFSGRLWRPTVVVKLLSKLAFSCILSGKVVSSPAKYERN